MHTSDQGSGATDSLEERRAAALDVADAVRRANVVLAATEATVEQLTAAATVIRAAVADLAVVTRPLNEVSRLDDLATGDRFFNPVSGAGSPMSPPLVVVTTPEGVSATTTLDRRFEGPPGFVHGGISALMFDELFGTAMVRSGRWGMTANLTVNYRRALPLDTELVVSGAVTSFDGRKTWVEGSIELPSQPGVVFVTATALFIEPRESTRELYFGGLVDSSGSSMVGNVGGLFIAEPS